MVFYPPSWVPEITQDAPDSIPLHEFMIDETYGRQPLNKSRNPFTCGLTGRTHTTADLHLRSDYLARALAKRTGWAPSDDLTPWDKVAAIFSINTIDYIIPAYAAHKLNGIVTPANAAYAADELEHQLRSSGTGVIFTCVSLLGTALKAADAAGLKRDRVFLLPTVGDEAAIAQAPFPTIEDLIAEGKQLEALEPIKWLKGQGRRQVAFINYSSGTSGLPKAVMISHYNIIANIISHVAHESVARKQKGIETQVELGLLPMSHIYGLVVVAHTATWRGDEIIVLPKFELKTYLDAIQRFRIEHLIVVPPMVIAMLQQGDVCAKYDLSSVRFVYSGAAPLGEETIAELAKTYPKWIVAQAYGCTESAVVVCSSSEHDVMTKSSGSLVPGVRAKLMDPVSGKEITEHDKPGEIWVQSPSVVLGYLNNEKATAETFVHDTDGRWLRTGDEVYVTKSPQGHEHIVIVDRIKELIKVKGHQVAPAELEAHILTHPAVSDVAVTQVPDERAGEVPKAFVVKSPEYKNTSDEEMAKLVTKHVADHKASYKWIKGGVEVMEAIPKSPSGKILRRLLRDREKERRRKEGAKI
ncbi:hypothetical protein MCOR25_006461 [Pyricularia grisea]|nr:hypothetical protein MCOR25_006461 [Pyricularia grisea]